MNDKKNLSMIDKNKEYAKDIINCFWDMYEDEQYDEAYIDKMTSEEAKNFCLEHIEFVVGTNGTEYLFELEKEIIEYYKLEV